jgi:hypothetical protein
MASSLGRSAARRGRSAREPFQIGFWREGHAPPKALEAPIHFGLGDSDYCGRHRPSEPHSQGRRPVLTLGERFYTLSAYRPRDIRRKLACPRSPALSQDERCLERDLQTVSAWLTAALSSWNVDQVGEADRHLVNHNAPRSQSDSQAIRRRDSGLGYKVSGLRVRCASPLTDLAEKQ